MEKLILVGSTYFFKNYEDFKSKDIDKLILVDNPNSFYYSRQITTSNSCLFEWRRMSPRRFINHTLKFNNGMELGKFLVPEFVREIGFTIDDLKELKPVLKNLDDKHKYLEVIYNAYLINNDFVLTKEQRDIAYNVYKEARNGI